MELSCSILFFKRTFWSLERTSLQTHCSQVRCIFPVSKAHCVRAKEIQIVVHTVICFQHWSQTKTDFIRHIFMCDMADSIFTSSAGKWKGIFSPVDTKWVHKLERIVLKAVCRSLFELTGSCQARFTTWKSPGITRKWILHRVPLYHR